MSVLNGPDDIFGSEDEPEGGGCKGLDLPDDGQPPRKVCKKSQPDNPPNPSLEVLLDLADTIKGNARTRGYWRRSQLTKLIGWEHLVDAADLEHGLWMMCKPCGKRINCVNAPFNVIPFQKHCERLGLATAHLKRNQSSIQTSLASHFIVSPPTKGNPAATSHSEVHWSPPLAGQLHASAGHKDAVAASDRPSELTNNVKLVDSCQGLDLSSFLSYIDVPNDLRSLLSFDLSKEKLLSDAAMVFFRLSAHKHKFGLAHTDGVETLHADPHLGLVHQRVCQGCHNLLPLVKQAWYEKQNKKGHYEGPMVKLLHAYYARLSSSWDRSAIRAFHKVIPDGPKKTFDPIAFDIFKQPIKARYNFAVFLQEGGPLVEAILQEANQGGKAPHETFLYRSSDFLTNQKCKADRDSAVLGLYKALVARAKGARTFDTGMDPSLKAKTLAAALNVNLISPKSGRMLHIVLDEVCPSESTLKRAKRREVMKPEISILGVLNPTEAGIFAMLDAQVLDDTRVFSASMDEIVLGRGLAARRMANPETGKADIVVLGVKDPLSVEQVKARGGSPGN